MATAQRAKSKAPITVNEKMALKYVREAIAAFHPKAGDLKTLGNEVKLKNTTDGMILIWGDEKFELVVQTG